MKDGVALMYVKNGVLYPVALTNEENEMLQLISRVFNPLKVVFDQPQGRVVNLLEKRGM